MECHTEWREIAMQEPRWEQFEKQSPDSYFMDQDYISALGMCCIL